MIEGLSSAQSQPNVATLSPQKRAEMERAAKDFEAVFMAQMLKPMWEGIESDPLFGGGVGEDVMRDLLVQEYGKAMAAGGNSGLSDVVMNEMIRMQTGEENAQ